ncbi:MAG: BatA domain-containing protein, partial [Bryobacteraceae bacterium]
MGFLAPWFLAGLAAVGLPIWIHLLRQHKTVPKPFSSLMFFERRTQSSVKHRRLQYFLLLALRIALIALLALAFANPYISRAPLAAGGSKLLVLAVDHSFSMRDGDRLARAKQLASDAVGNLRPGDYGQVMAVAADVQVLTQPTEDPAALRAAIAAIEPGDGRSSFAEFSRFLRTASEQAKRPLEVHFASDMQASSMPPSFADLRLDPGTNMVMHPVATAAEPNWAVENVTAPRSLYDPKKARIQAVIAGYATPAARREVSLVLNGKVVGTKTVDVPASGRASVQFVSLDAPYGFNRCEVRIDGADRLKQDDRFDFAVERADPRKVLFLYEPQRDKA